jgi:hypothetical protein
VVGLGVVRGGPRNLVNLHVMQSMVVLLVVRWIRPLLCLAVFMMAFAGICPSMVWSWSMSPESTDLSGRGLVVVVQDIPMVGRLCFRWRSSTYVSVDVWMDALIPLVSCTYVMPVGRS